MADLIYRAAWMASPDVPLAGPAGANIPEIVIVRNDTGAVVQAATDMTEQANVPGSYVFAFAPPDDALTYTARADGDPAAIGQVQTGTRFKYGAGDARATDANELTQTNVDATISSRSTHSAADAADAVQSEALADHLAAGSKGLADAVQSYNGPHGVAVHFDAAAANVGTTVGDDGTYENPVSSAAAAFAILAALGAGGCRRVVVLDGLFSLDADRTGFDFIGSCESAGFSFNGFASFGSCFLGLTVLGAYGTITTGAEIRAEDCQILNCTNVTGSFERCSFTGVQTFNTAAAGLTLHDCYSSQESSTVAAFDFTSSAFPHLMRAHGWAGHIAIRGIADAGSRAELGIADGSRVTLEASCVAGIADIHGTREVIDSSAGMTVRILGDGAELADVVLTAAHDGGSWAGAGLTPTQDDRLRYVHKWIGGDPLQKVTHSKAAIGTPGATTTPDAEIDQVVEQVDADTATVEQQ